MRLVHLFSVASVCAALSACDTPIATSVAAPVDASPVVQDEWVVPWNGVDVSRSLDGYRADLSGLSADRRQELSDAASEITRNCPYNRASVSLPLTVSAVLGRHQALLNDPAFRAVAPEASRHLEGMVTNVATWASIYETLGVADLPAPRAGDYLETQALVLAVDLQAPDDALAALSLALDAVPSLVDGYDPRTLAKIEAAQATLDGAFEGGWPLKIELIAFRNSIEQVMKESRMRATTAPEELQAAFAWLDRDMLALKELIDTFVSLRC